MQLYGEVFEKNIRARVAGIFNGITGASPHKTIIQGGPFILPISKTLVYTG
ncbi:hypothetical protein H4W29_002438 [Rhizobium viscosum]|uniref:Uncharacterized protein n=1 Tax=Rhizobium viscosum TaxID=1673 RepID=A0ABR9IPY0_RHIVS|nr:hypothetical protein [Rhizobium viscosum]